MNNAMGRRYRSSLAVVVAAAAMLGASTTGQGKDGGDEPLADRPDESQIKRGFEIVPGGVALNLAVKNRALVGLGSYIVNTTGCNDCHTHRAYAPGGDPFQGQPEMINAAQYLAGGRTFGPFTSANLTPDHSGKPAGLTLTEFIRVLRTGHDPKDPPRDVLQVMPWPVFGKKTDRDLTAIYEYLRAIPSLPNNPNPGQEP
jgi:hypothetical protein